MQDYQTEIKNLRKANCERMGTEFEDLDDLVLQQQIKLRIDDPDYKVIDEEIGQ